MPLVGPHSEEAVTKASQKEVALHCGPCQQAGRLPGTERCGEKGKGKDSKAKVAQKVQGTQEAAQKAGE